MFRTVILSAAILSGLAVQSQAADLAVTVTGAKPASGQFLLSVFDRSEAWMKQPVTSKNLTVTPEGTATATFDLASGTYAVALTHDANGNGKMDTNALGIPTEAFGFSNRARARFGPPAFRKATFNLPEPGARLTISLDSADR